MLECANNLCSENKMVNDKKIRKTSIDTVGLNNGIQGIVLLLFLWELRRDLGWAKQVKRFFKKAFDNFSVCFKLLYFFVDAIKKEICSFKSKRSNVS